VAALGVANEFFIILLCSFLGGITQLYSSYDDTQNMLSTGIIVGAFVPMRFLKD